MAYLRRKQLFLPILIFLNFLIFGKELPEEIFLPDSVSVDMQNTAKGGNAVISGLGHFTTNPSYSLINRRYTISGIFLNDPRYWGVALYDSKTTKIGAGLIYHADTEDFKQLKANIAIPFFDLIFSGINFHYFQTRDSKGSKISGYSGDVGVSTSFFEMLSFGCSINDLITFKGYDVPRRINGGAEISLFKNLLSITAGGNYHLDHKKENYIYEREKLRYFDISAGADLNLSIFIISGGLSVSAFDKEISWESALKSLGAAIYKGSKGGIFFTYLREKKWNTYGIQITLEPF